MSVRGLIECILSKPYWKRRASSSTSPMNALIFTYHRAAIGHRLYRVLWLFDVNLWMFSTNFTPKCDGASSLLWDKSPLIGITIQLSFSWGFYGSFVNIQICICPFPLQGKVYDASLRVNTIREEMKVSIGSNSTVCPSIYLNSHDPFLTVFWHLCLTSSTLVHLFSYQLPGSKVGGYVHDLLSMT